MRILIFILSFVLIAESLGVGGFLSKFDEEFFLVLEDENGKEEKQEELSSKETDKHLTRFYLSLVYQIMLDTNYYFFDEKDIHAGFSSFQGQPPEII